MKRFKHDVLVRLVKVVNIILIAFPFFWGWVVFYNDKITKRPFGHFGLSLVFLLFCFIYAMFGRIYDAFMISIQRISEMIYSQTLAILFSDLVMYVVTALLMRKIPIVWPFLLIGGLQLILSTFWSYAAHKWYFHTFPPLKTIIIYDVREGMDSLIQEYGLNIKFNVVKTLHISEALENNLRVLRENHVGAFFLCGVHSKERNILLKYCVENSITVYLLPRIGDVIMSSASRMHMFHLPILRVDRYKPKPEFVVVKRLFDIVASLLGMVVLSPIFLIVSVAIKCDDKGPILYGQRRLTKDRKEFTLYKFRSMRTDAEKDGIARLSTGDNDTRITKVGKVIRKYRIDELPQLWNIFIGDMSVVGPRPERPEIAREYEEEMPEFSLRLQAKAGLTGYAQVFGKYNTSPYDKLQMDLMYIANPSLLEDIRILFATIKILFLPESTEGIAEGLTNALDSDRKNSDYQ